MAYVGKGPNGLIMRIGRVQVYQPGRGVHLGLAGRPFFLNKGGFYLVDNPNYNYYWVDSAPMVFHSNAVAVKIGGGSKLSDTVARIQIDGKTDIGINTQVKGAFFFDGNGNEFVASNFQVLVCDPKPVNPCSKFQLFKIPNN
jgi:hypothetical protein